MAADNLNYSKKNIEDYLVAYPAPLDWKKSDRVWFLTCVRRHVKTGIGKGRAIRVQQGINTDDVED